MSFNVFAHIRMCNSNYSSDFCYIFSEHLRSHFFPLTLSLPFTLFSGDARDIPFFLLQKNLPLLFRMWKFYCEHFKCHSTYVSVFLFLNRFDVFLFTLRFIRIDFVRFSGLYGISNLQTHSQIKQMPLNRPNKTTTNNIYSMLGRWIVQQVADNSWHVYIYICTCVREIVITILPLLWFFRRIECELFVLHHV